MFTVHRGQTRIVVVIGNVIACKFPRARPRYAWRGFVESLQFYGWRGLFVWTSVEGVSGWQRPLLGGWVANFREAWFWVRHRHAFCVPTYVSLLGLVNIQPVATMLEWSDREVVWGKAGEVLGRRIMDDVHHFHYAHSGNWVRYGGTVRLSDYGSTVTQAIIAESGDAIVDALREQS